MRWLTPSLADLIFVVCLAFSIVVGTRMLSADGDPARHLVVGEQMLRSRSILREDIFSYTMVGQPFVPYEWLAEVASAASYHLAGLAGPVLLHGAAFATTFGILFAQLRRRQPSLLLAVGITVLAIVASRLHWLARPHAFTVLGAVVFSALLDSWYRGGSVRRLWALPPIMLVWANCHGGFLIGFILMGTYLAADVARALFLEGAASTAARRRLLALAPVAALSLGVVLVNPAGPALLLHVTGYLGNQLLLDRTVEYMSPNFHRAYTRGFLALLLITATAMAWSRHRPALHEVLLFAAFTYFSLYSARNIPLFAVVIAPVASGHIAALPLAESAPRWLRRRSQRVVAWLARRDAAYGRIDRRAIGHLWCVAGLAAVLGVAAVQHRSGIRPLGLDFYPAAQPVAAAAYLKEHPPTGNGFNQLHWGGYLLYALWPEQRVFIDGQTDFYGEPLAREYLEVAELKRGWREVLDRWNVRWVVYPTDTPLVRLLAEQNDWRVSYQDEMATVLVRRDADAR